MNGPLRISGTLALVFLILPSSLRGDGGFFPPRLDPATKAELREPEQLAILHHADGMETLFLQVKYEGNLSEFGWVIPVPSKPEVETADSGLFEAVQELKDRLRFLVAGEEAWDRTLSDSHKEAGGNDGGEDLPPVRVVERKKVGAFDIVVLASDDAGALRTWLDKQGFVMPPGAEEILAPYVDRKFFFVAVRVDTTLKKGARQGEFLKPLALKFSSAAPFFPLRISRINNTLTDVVIHYLHRKGKDGCPSLFHPALAGEGDLDIEAVLGKAEERLRGPTEKLRERYGEEFFTTYRSETGRAAEGATRIEKMLQKRIPDLRLREHHLCRLSAEFLPHEMTEDLVLATVNNATEFAAWSRTFESWQRAHEGRDYARSLLLACASDDLTIAGAALRRLQIDDEPWSPLDALDDDERPMQQRSIGKKIAELVDVHHQMFVETVRFLKGNRKGGDDEEERIRLHLSERRRALLDYTAAVRLQAMLLTAEDAPSELREAATKSLDRTRTIAAWRSLSEANSGSADGWQSAWHEMKTAFETMAARLAGGEVVDRTWGYHFEKSGLDQIRLTVTNYRRRAGWDAVGYWSGWLTSWEEHEKLPFGKEGQERLDHWRGVFVDLCRSLDQLKEFSTAVDQFDDYSPVRRKIVERWNKFIDAVK